MEKPFYGRTGLLDAGRDGVPVQTPRLLALAKTGRPVAAPSLRWAPTMLTAPQRLLNHFAHGRPVDDSLVEVLRLGSIVALLSRALRMERAATAALSQRVLRWRRDAMAGGADGWRRAPPPRLSWYLPEYKIIIVKDGHSIGSMGDISRRAVTLLGKDRTLSDVALDHPSCSAQHAALEASFVLSTAVEDELMLELQTVLTRVGASAGSSPSASLLEDERALRSVLLWLWRRLAHLQREEWRSTADPADAAGSDSGDEGEPAEVDGSSGSSAALNGETEEPLRLKRPSARGATTLWSLELLLTDLGSTNGTFVNGTRLAAYSPMALIEGDVVTFGASSRQYVVMRGGGAAA